MDIDELGREPLKIRFYSKGPAVLYIILIPLRPIREYTNFSAERSEMGYKLQNSVVRVGSELAAKLKKNMALMLYITGRYMIILRTPVPMNGRLIRAEYTQELSFDKDCA